MRRVAASIPVQPEARLLATTPNYWAARRTPSDPSFEPAESCPAGTRVVFRGRLFEVQASGFPRAIGSA
ncbi:MAG TPA: hypothetical protein VLT47_11030 [Anaeromyxobacteraceae bacterium]|nr:hypothetical protein [Anaeromyxobacteraceae bacterium]